jgi:hypothetical protein
VPPHIEPVLHDWKAYDDSSGLDQFTYQFRHVETLPCRNEVANRRLDEISTRVNEEAERWFLFQPFYVDVLALDDAKRDLELVFPHADGEIGVVGAVVIEHSTERRTRENVSVNYQHCIVELFQ